MKQVICLLLLVFCVCEVFAKKRYIIRKVGDDYDVSPVLHDNYVHEGTVHHDNYVHESPAHHNNYVHESPAHHKNYVHKPHPYHFGYNVKDEKGNNQYHKEEGNEYNHKKGSYGYTDAYGIYRHVDYIADDKGFRAKIRTNEPGVGNYHPADVYIHAEQPPKHVNSLYHKKPYYPQEPLHHHQEEEYEAYHPDAKERVAYVPVYSPPGNSKGKEYYVR